MKRTVLHILCLFAAVSLLLGSCSRGRVIPRKKMIDIYADMFMADQWIKEDYQYRRMTDTTLLYEPIFESYGYTTDDYLKSVEKYMKDPERFSRMLKKTAAKLEKELAHLEKRMDQIHFSATSREEIEEWMREVISRRALDSLVFSSFVKEPSDTSWDGVRMVIDSAWRLERDSLALRDSVVRDSLARLDSLAAKADSLAETEAVKPSADEPKVVEEAPLQKEILKGRAGMKPEIIREEKKINEMEVLK